MVDLIGLCLTSLNFLPQYLSKAFKDIIWMLSYSAHECYRMVKEFPWKIIKCGRYEVMCVRARARVLQTWYPHSSHIYWYFVPNLIDSEPKLPEETDSVTQKDHKWIVCEILRLYSKKFTMMSHQKTPIFGIFNLISQTRSTGLS